MMLSKNILILSFILAQAEAFSIRPHGLSSPSKISLPRLKATTTELTSTMGEDLVKQQQQQQQQDRGADEVVGVRAPMKWVGPYPALGLRFPSLATEAQRSRNVTGVSLDFVLDTAANSNTINGQVAKELQLKVVGQQLPGVGAASAWSGGNIYLLGDSQLEGVQGNFTFMTNLSASALPVATPTGPTTAGLLSLAFLQAFDGVDFHWGRPGVTNATSVDDEELLPYITFYRDVPKTVLESRTRVHLHRDPVSQLASVTMEVNGTKTRALLDTGSPITILSTEAAKQAGIEHVPPPEPKNPFAAITNLFQPKKPSSEEQKPQQTAQHAPDVLTIYGASGGRMNTIHLLRSTEKVHVELPGSNGDKVNFGSGHVYVGDLPGLAAFKGVLGMESSVPAVILGLDALRQRPDMLVRAPHNEVWF